MTKINLHNLTVDYKKSAILYCDSIQNGHHQIANQQYKLFESIRKQLSVNLEIAEKFYLNLINDCAYQVQYVASVHCKMLGINTAKANKILQDLVARDDIGIIRLNAKMSLQNWNIK